VVTRALEARIVNSAFSEFPIIGDQLHSQLGLASLHHSTPALVIGLLGAVLGGRGLANVLQNVLNLLWQVPKVDWPGFLPRYARTFALLGLLALGTVFTALAAAAAAAASVLGVSGAGVHVIAIGLSTVLDSGLFLAAFRLATANTVATRDLVRGAVASAVAWQILLIAAGLIVAHYLRHAQAIAGLFGIVLGMLAWFALQATVTLYAVQADVVRARRLWPRSITQPPLTSGDKRYLAGVAAIETRRPEQHVITSFTDIDHPAGEPHPVTSAHD
jgi:membrane protein